MSTLSPLLFWIYYSIFTNVLSVRCTLLFAKETHVFIHGKYLDDLIISMNEELDKIAQCTMSTNYH